MTGAGADPSQDLEELAKNEIGSNRFYAISMGQGQQQNAVDTLRRAAENGDWVCLKNLHLVIASLPAIQKEIMFFGSLMKNVGIATFKTFCKKLPQLCSPSASSICYNNVSLTGN
uniref:Dynein heavy chain region D6 P-loop domain-containing protein n=1 Tax=Parascaris equorum TaxID=6256 RepID=A0A914RBW7_PAREQ